MERKSLSLTHQMLLKVHKIIGFANLQKISIVYVQKEQ